MSNDKCYYVYILANKNNKVLYIGFTSNLLNRIYQHKHKLFPGFTKKYNVDKLVYYEVLEDPLAGIGREKQLKHWNREWKINLIKTQNPDFIDLSQEVLNW